LAVANRLVEGTDRDPAETFRSVYGITDSNPLVFTMGSCDARTAADGSLYGGCADENGDKAGAYTWGSRDIEFYSGDPFYSNGGNRTRTDVYNANIHLVVHELGHAFASRFGSSAISPYLMVDQAKFSNGQSYLSSDGFASAPSESINGYWRPNKNITMGETFANMFLGWVFDTWADDINGYGDQRGTYMSDNMKNIWLPALAP